MPFRTLRHAATFAAGAMLAAALTLLGCTGLDSFDQKRRAELPPPEADIDSIGVFPQDNGHAIDVNHVGRGEVLRVGIFLFSRKTHRSTLGDGALVVRLLQPRGQADTQPAVMDELYTWELNRDEMQKITEKGGVSRVTTGWQYRLGLTWPGKFFDGPALLQVEFHSANGSVVMGQDKVVNMTPIDRNALGSSAIRERPTVTEVTSTQPTGKK